VEVPPNNQQPAAPAPGGNPGQPANTPAGAAAAQPKPPAQNTTQNSLLISEIRDGMVIMSDGSFRAVVACKSINFDLMSSREREGVEFSYQNFLNALYFPIQIFIRSQRVDIGPYIDRLAQIRRSQDNMLLNVLMDDYINFIDILSQEANIMDKSFFIVIPYYPAGDISNVLEQSKGIFGKLFSKPQTTATRIDKVQYEKAKDEIKNRVDSVTSGLFQIGVKSVQLNTKELGELYYNVYNPDTAVREPLGDFENVTSTFVRKGQGEAPRPHLQEGSM
jgi:type IV secretory pathway VirB4 component